MSLLNNLGVVIYESMNSNNQHKLKACSCGEINIPQEAIYCPSCGKRLDYSPSIFAIEECRRSLEMNKYIARDVICELLSISYCASTEDIINEIQKRIE